MPILCYFLFYLIKTIFNFIEYIIYNSRFLNNNEKLFVYLVLGVRSEFLVRRLEQGSCSSS